MHDLALIVSVVIATLVEAVEALTIVLAAGLAKGWKPARRGTLLGLATVALIIVCLGPLLLQFPVETLRLIVGLLSLIFGLQWLRKAIFRASGFKELHDEEKIFQRELNQAKAAKSKSTNFVGDWYAFTISYKAVLIEGVEVAFLVVTFGAVQGKILVASLAAAVAVVIVIASGFFLHKPLTKVPENTMKFVVGLILTTFGIFWTTEGSGFEWTLKDLSLFPILGIVSATAVLLIYILKFKKKRNPESKIKMAYQPKLPLFLEFIYDFLIGDDWPTALVIYSTVTLMILGIGFEWLFASVIAFILIIRLIFMTKSVSRAKQSN